MKKFKFFAPLALAALLSAPVYSQSATSSNSHTALSIVGTPDDADLARQIFPDVPDQSGDLLIAAGTADETVRIGIRGHESTIQVTSDATNVRGSFSIGSGDRCNPTPVSYRGESRHGNESTQQVYIALRLFSFHTHRVMALCVRMRHS